MGGAAVAAGGPLALSLLLKATLILGAAWLLALSARRSSAAVRHGVWIAALAAVTALPAAAPWLPPLEVELPELLQTLPRAAPAASQLTTVVVTAPPAAGASAVAPPPAGLAETGDASPASSARDDGALSWPLLLLGLWITGIAIRGLWLAAQLLRVRWIVRAARLVGGAPALAAAAAAGRLRVRRSVTVLESDRVATPVTCGIRHPLVLLPVGSSEWPAERLRVVLLHELAHIRRGDYLCCLLAELACALYWPVPLIWVARLAIQAEQEQASDDLVLAAGTSPVDYADHLLAIARTLRPDSSTPSATIGMAREAGLKRRIRTILDGRTRRVPLASIQGAMTISLLALCAVPLAALRPVDSRAERSDAAPHLQALPAELSSAPAVPDRRMPQARLHLWLEVENGVLRGRSELREDLDASEGYFVDLPDDAAAGEALLSLHLPRAGEYHVWARAMARGEDAALTLSIDRAARRTTSTRLPGAGSGWAWIRLTDAASSPLALDAGVHTVRLASERDGVRVDRLLVTTDEGYVPSDRGAEPEGFTPTFRWIDIAAGPLDDPAEFDVDLPTAGPYVVWGRVLGRDQGANSFYLSVDDGPELVWDAPDEELGREQSRWVWDPASARDIDGRSVDPLIFQLAAGRHTLRLRPREEGTGIGGLLVTNDLTYRPRGRAPGSPPVQIWLDAESAAPGEALRVRRGAGSLGDGYLEAAERGSDRSDPGEHDPAALSFELPAAGVYTLWGRTVARSDGENSFWLRVNGGRWMRWNDIPRSRDWRWSAVHDGDGDADPVQLLLPAGENRIEIARREGGARLDRLVLTNDEIFEPVEALAE